VLKIGICAEVLPLPTDLLAGEANALCDKHATNSVFSWNPTEQIVTPRDTCDAVRRGLDSRVNDFQRMRRNTVLDVVRRERAAQCAVTWRRLPT
jgi:hypothetical protein